MTAPNLGWDRMNLRDSQKFSVDRRPSNQALQPTIGAPRQWLIGR